MCIRDSLCTVALRGHEKLVRPTRMGLRRGERIVVNRQLCVANAFEQLLEAVSYTHLDVSKRQNEKAEGETVLSAGGFIPDDCWMRGKETGKRHGAFYDLPVSPKRSGGQRSA